MSQKKNPAATNLAYEMLNCRLEKSLAKDLLTMSEETKLSKTAIVHKALAAYLGEYKKNGTI